MRVAGWLGLAMLLAGCSGSGGLSVAPPSPAALEDGDCNMVAQEREAEAGWLDVDADGQKRVFQVAYDDCQQWKAGHVWKN